MSDEQRDTTLSALGASMIARERRRQIREHRFYASRDDQYTDGELVLAAMHYADNPDAYKHDSLHLDPFWPVDWDRRYDQKRTDDRITQLVKAGALIAAEIDRLLRAAADPR